MASSLLIPAVSRGATPTRRAVCAGRALHHHDTGPGGPGACVSGARTAAKGPLAIGDYLAARTPPGGVDAVDGTRRRERSGGDRAGHTPCADMAGTETDRAAGVAGGHPSS